MGAVVTVLPLNVFMVYAGTSLPFTVVLEEWLQYLHGCNSVPQKMSAEWSHGTVCHCAVLCCVKECCYLMISIKHGSLETSVHVGFLSAYCSSTVFVSVLFICSSTLTAVVCTHDTETSSLCFLSSKGVTCFDPYWPRHLASTKMGACLCFLQKVQFRILPCTVDHISFTDRGEKSPITT
jgi:hypothetical protein